MKKEGQAEEDRYKSYVAERGELVLRVSEAEYLECLKETEGVIRLLNHLESPAEIKAFLREDKLQEAAETALDFLERVKKEVYLLEEKTKKGDKGSGGVEYVEDLKKKIKGLYEAAARLAQTAKNIAEDLSDAKLAEEFRGLAFKIESQLKTRDRYTKVMEFLNEIS